MAESTKVPAARVFRDNISIDILKLVVLVTAVTVVAGQDSLLVYTPQGPVRGYKAPDADIYVFHGIPYASAPVGDQKYKAPLPPPQWTSTFEATDQSIICPQAYYFQDMIGKIQQEDCLIANVYVPAANSTNLPVVIYVHGGAFQTGWGNQLTAKELIRKENMVIVNFNYRLGMHGFLCLGTEDVPGNAGMKDQIALLRWVKRNIAGFGGNPDDVTIIGYSAGASSVDLLLLSPIAKGLFNKIIPDSGASLNAFSVQSDPIEVAWRFANLLNFTNPTNDIYALERFYKSISINTTFSVDVMSLPDATFFTAPCVERHIGEEMFLNDAPLNILKNRKNQKVPILFGFAEMEGLFRIPYFEIWKNKMNNRFTEFLPADLKFSSNEERQLVAQKIKQFYFGSQPVSQGSIFRYIDYFTDTVFAYGALRSAKLHIESGNNEVYLYEYSFVDENTPFVPQTQVRGSDHCSQTMVIGDGIPFYQSTTDESEDLKQMRDLMRDLWINFILTGKPVPEGSALPKWPSADGNGGPHMVLDKTMKLRGPLLHQRILFWDTIYEKYYRIPVPPSVN